MPSTSPASSGTVAFKATNAGFNWTLTADISGTVAYEGQFLKVVVSSCVLSRPTTFTSPADNVDIGAGVSCLTSDHGRWNVQRGTDLHSHSIRQSLPPGQKLELPPFTLNIPIDNFEVKAGDWLTFSVTLKNIKDGKETMGYVPVHWHSLAPLPAGLRGGHFCLPARVGDYLERFDDADGLREVLQPSDRRVSHLLAFREQQKPVPTPHVGMHNHPGAELRQTHQSQDALRLLDVNLLQGFNEVRFVVEVSLHGGQSRPGLGAERNLFIEIPCHFEQGGADRSRVRFYGVSPLGFQIGRASCRERV